MSLYSDPHPYSEQTAAAPSAIRLSQASCEVSEGESAPLLLEAKGTHGKPFASSGVKLVPLGSDSGSETCFRLSSLMVFARIA